MLVSGMVFPIENGDFPACYVGLPECIFRVKLYTDETSDKQPEKIWFIYLYRHFLFVALGDYIIFFRNCNRDSPCDFTPKKDS